MYTVAQKITPTQHQILLIGKRVVDFLSVLTELFCYVLRLTRYKRK